MPGNLSYLNAAKPWTKKEKRITIWVLFVILIVVMAFGAAAFNSGFQQSAEQHCKVNHPHQVCK